MALGTVADVVRLDANNRRLVAQGLKRIRAGQMPAGPRRCCAMAGRQPAMAATFDFGFALGRASTRRRLADYDAGHRMPADRRRWRADELAHQLDAINRERRGRIETGMREQAD